MPQSGPEADDPLDVLDPIRVEQLLVGTFEEALREEGGELARRFGEFDPADSDSMLDWSEAIGTRIRSVPAIREIFLHCLDKLQRNERIRVVVQGPRGGGKTQLVATIEAMAYLFFGWSWVNMGASKEQAFRCYEHLKEFTRASPELQRYTEAQQVTFTRAINGALIKVLAATETSFRGAHPVGNREGGKGGGCTLDEAAIIPDETIDDAKGVLTPADPSALIQISTMGKMLRGRFFQLNRKPEKQGYTRFAYDLFDVASRCQYECSECPVPEFANRFTPPGATQDRAPLCGGKAHDTDGWVPIDEIAQQWRELPYAAFMREYMGEATRLAGQIYRGDLIERAKRVRIGLSKDPEQERRRFRSLDKAVGVDWGFSGQTAVVYVVLVRGAAVPYRWEFFTEETFESIRQRIIDRAFSDLVPEVLCDSSHPNENVALRQGLRDRWNDEAERAIEAGGSDLEAHSCRVTSVAFSKWKAFGIGECVRRLEKEECLFPRTVAGMPVEGYEEALDYLARYHYDNNGKPVKEDDHAPDAWLCANLRWAPKFRRESPKP